MVEELTQFGNICLCVTSRISTIPPACENLNVPTLSAKAAGDTFYRIYKSTRQSDLIDNILEQLEFHPLSITLLATVAHHNVWDVDRLSREWERQRTNVLRTKYNISLATTIELSLASPMFQELGPDARDLLGVVAFFPQGINENNLEWFFPTLPNRTDIFDDFCILSLTYRSNGFITMLAPLRDYLSPKDPTSSPLLCATKDHYLHRLSADVYPTKPGFEEARWITSEDVNVEHLLDVFTSIDTNSVAVWKACSDFMTHLCWHKPRPVTLWSKIEGLPDDHPSKPQCLDRLAWSFDSVGNNAELKRLLGHNLKFWMERGDDLMVAEVLRCASRASWLLGLHEEGIQQAKEALEIYERFNNLVGQGQSWRQLAHLSFGRKQFDAAEEATSKAIELLSEGGDQYEVCGCYRLLGDICCSRGETEKAINHFEAALEIASSFNWHNHLFWNHYCLAELSSRENRFDDAHVRVERAKVYATNNPYRLGRAMELQARFWYKQRMFGKARSEAVGAVDIFETLGMAKELGVCRTLLRKIEEEASQELDSGGELLETTIPPALINYPFSA